MNRDWYCPGCNFKIFGSKSRCVKCNIQRPSSLFSSSTQTTIKQPTDQYSKAVANVSDQIFDIKDKLTDAEYKDLLDTLKTCYDKAPQTTSTTVFANKDWMCNTCNFKIFASKSECKKCGSKRPF
jgi:hypothetical protein